MRSRSTLRLASLTIAGLSVSLVCLPALAQTTVRIPASATPVRELGNRLLTMETPFNVSPGRGLVEGLLVTSQLTGAGASLQNLVAGTGLTTIVDYGLSDRVGLQVQAGLSTHGVGPVSVMGKYGLLSEGTDRAPLSVGVYARVQGNLPPFGEMLQLNFRSANAGVTFGLPLSRTVTDRLTVMAVPGLSLVGTTSGLITTGNLGLAADFAISPGLRGILETRLGALPAGISPISAGLRYSFTDALLADVFFGLGGVTPAGGLGFGLAVPSLGLGGYYRF